jgi:probable phosphoglycerate mutase
MGEVVLIRHGETEWSRGLRHTSFTDLPLTAVGERQARALAPALAGRRLAAVLSSPRQRARRTAELAGITISVVEDDLAEWDYGHYEGLTTTEIHQDCPEWLLWTDGCPGGESPDEIEERIDRVLARLGPMVAIDDVAVVGHGHALRVLAARWIGLPAAGGRLLRLDTASLSTLGFEHASRVVSQWNTTVASG